MTPKWCEEHDVLMLSLAVILDGKEYEEHKDISPKEVYETMRNDKTVPKTAQIGPDTFLATFTALAEQKQPAIYIALSSGLSGTYQTAELIRKQVLEEHPDFELTIIDSKCVSLGLGRLVYQAVQWRDKGLSYQELIKNITDFAETIVHIFTVDDLVYLERGGRVSKVAAFMGGLLHIKPILHVDEGKLVPLEKTRGNNKRRQRMLQLMEDQGQQLEKQTVFISHGDAPDEAEAFKRDIQERFGTSSFYINTIGAAIGSHAGPGTIALFFTNQLSD